MVTNEEPPKVDVLSFHPYLKCCTYLPELANFLVGRILDDQNPELSTGKTTIEARIRAGIAVSPLDLRLTQGFGRSMVAASAPAAPSDAVMPSVVLTCWQMAAAEFGSTVTRFARPGSASTSAGRGV